LCARLGNERDTKTGKFGGEIPQGSEERLTPRIGSQKEEDGPVLLEMKGGGKILPTSGEGGRRRERN